MFFLNIFFWNVQINLYFRISAFFNLFAFSTLHFALIYPPTLFTFFFVSNTLTLIFSFFNFLSKIVFFSFLSHRITFVIYIRGHKVCDCVCGTGVCLKGFNVMTKEGEL